MGNKSYSYSFSSGRDAEQIFETLKDVPQWWHGLFGEDINGSYEMVNDEFTFKAGDGVHYSKQRLSEIDPSRKIAWLVTESNLTFANKTDEWTGTEIGFEITPDGEKNKITFTHTGLAPKMECYESCSGAWTMYLQRLEEKLK